MEDEVFIGGDVFGGDFQEEIGVAGDMVAFHNFLDFHDGVEEIGDGFFAVAEEGDFDEGEGFDADGGGIDEGDEFIDDFILFEFFDAVEGGRGRDADFLGEGGIGDASVGLEDFQYFDVGLIELHGIIPFY